MKKKCNYNLIATFVCYFTIVLVGCEKSNENVDASYYAQLYADSAFLQIKGDIREPEVIWANVETYSCAFRRIERHLISKDGLVSWDFQNASELKISENIYDYIINFLNNNNHNKSASRSTFTANRPHFFDDIEELKVLKQGKHIDNMYILIDIAYRTKREGDYPDPIYANLDDCITVKYSEFRGDGVGNVCVSGEHGASINADDAWTYICCNACAFVEKNHWYCEFNDICGWNRDYPLGDERLVLFKVVNNMGLPLITLRNCHNFNEGGIAMYKKVMYIDYSRLL